MNLGSENEVTEFKEGIGQLDKGIKGLSAMLNRSNKGTVYFGVRDDGEVVGMDVGDSTFEKIRNAIRSGIKPQVIADIQIHDADDGKKYVSVHATGYDVPYSFDDRYYIRHAASNESATPETVARLVLSKGYDSPREIESPLDGLTFATLFDMLSARGYRPRDDKGFLNSLSLLNREGEYNLNAFLVSDQNNVIMQIVEFQGTVRTSFSKRTDYGGGCLFMSLRNMLESVRSRMETKIDVSDGQRREQDLFDFECFREALVNACVHSAWWTMAPPLVSLFDDRIEVESTGGLPPSIPLSDLYAGRSSPVNESLFRIASMLRFCEHTGRGIPTIVERYGTKAITPSEGFLKVTIPFSFEPGYVRSRKSSELGSISLTDGEKAVLEFLGNDTYAKLATVAEAVGMTPSAVKRTVSSLKSKGLLSNEGTNRNSVWVVKTGR